MRNGGHAAEYHQWIDSTGASCLSNRKRKTTAMLEEHRQANRANWDDRVPAHLASDFYGVEEFIAGARNLTQAVDFDRAHLGDVQGRSLLHVQCHIGLDTLSWARLGADVTGLDFSERSIQAARDISRRSSIPGRFVLADIHEAPEVLAETFNIGYASEGVLCWLPSVAAWARVVRRFTRPGGTFYIRDGHPLAHSLDPERPNGQLVMADPYFEGEAIRYDEPGTYTEAGVEIDHTITYEWNHSLGEIVSALADEGFRIESLREYPFSGYQAQPGMVQGDDGWWRLPDRAQRLPLLFGLKATLPPDASPVR